MPKEKQPKTKKPNIPVMIVSKCVLKNKILWARDIALAKRLFELIPDQEFWFAFQPLFQSDSMVFFSGEKAKQIFLTKYKIFKLEDTPKIEYNQEVGEKIGEDYSTPIKKPNLWEFIS